MSAPRSFLVAGALLALLLVAAAPAWADQELVGETGQGKAVTLTVRDDGRVGRMVVAWTATCRRDAGVRQASVVRPPRRLTTAQVFRVVGDYRDRQRRGGFRFRIRLVVRGTRDAAADRWTGTIRGTVRVTRRGRP